MLFRNILSTKPALLISGILLSITAMGASAACKFETGSAYGTMQTVLIPIKAANISVPPDTPPGTVIYQQNTYITTAQNMTIGCKNAGDISVFYEMDSTPLATNYSNVYETDIAGIGVQYSAGSNIFPTSIPATQLAQVSNPMMASFQPAVLDVTVKLIKTAATVSAGSYNMTNLPKGTYSAGRPNDNAPYYKFSFSGILQITTPTCDITPASASMTVKMGSYFNSYFSGIGSGSGWKDASIKLTNCPQFYGNSSISVGTYVGGTTFTNNAPLSSNFMEITLAPRNGINSYDNSVMNIDSSSSQASGIGIQLSTSQSETNKININNKLKYTFAKDFAMGALTIPLYARYIQTDSTITAGTANGKLEYIISYQ